MVRVYPTSFTVGDIIYFFLFKKKIFSFFSFYFLKLILILFLFLFLFKLIYFSLLCYLKSLFEMSNYFLIIHLIF